MMPTIASSVTRILILLGITATTCTAQERYAVTGGMAADLAAKLPVDGHNIGKTRRLLAATLAGYLEVRGTGYNEPGFLGQAGPDFDYIAYKIDRSRFISFTPYHLQLSGSIILPTVNRQLDLCVGISVRYYLGLDMKMMLSDNASGAPGTTQGFSMDLDSNYNKWHEAERKLLPAIQFGCRYRFPGNSRWNMYALISQQLLSELDGDIVLTYQVYGRQESLQVNHQPTFIRLGALCRLFWPSPIMVCSRVN